MAGATLPGRLDRSLAGWVAIGALIAAAVLFVLYSFVGTFVFGVFMYYATRPIYRRLRRAVRPPTLAAAASLLLLALPALLLVGFTLLIGVREFTALARQNQLNVVGMETRTAIYAQPYLNLLESPLELLTAPERLSAIRGALGQARPFLGTIGNAVLHLFVMVGVAFYLLRDDHRLSAWVRDRFADERGILDAYLDAVDRDYHQVFFGNILNAVLTGLIGAATYNALNFIAPAGLAVPYPTLLGLLAGAASLIPLVGMKLVYVPATIYLLGAALVSGRVDGLWFPVAFAVVSLVVVDVIPDLVLRPYVSGRSLHVGMVMFAYILGPLLFGWYGIFLGPMILVVAVQFTRVVLPEVLAALSGPAPEPARPPEVGPPAEGSGAADDTAEGT